MIVYDMICVRKMPDFPRITVLVFAIFWIINADTNRLEVLVAVRCQLSDNTPPTMWLERHWKIPETEPVGSKITVVNGNDNEGGQLEYGLEPLQYGSVLPFVIDNNTGVVYLNQSLKGRVGEAFLLYVTVFDGQLTAKSEVLVNIVNATNYNNNNFNNQHRLPPNLYQPSFLPLPFNPQANIPKTAIRLPGQPIFQEKTYPDVKELPEIDGSTARTTKNTNPDKTYLKPVTKKTTISTTTATTETTTTDFGTTNSVNLNVDNSIVPVDQPVKSEPDLAVTLVPVISVCAIFVAVGAIALVFRKKLCLGNIKGSKDDMRKDPTGGSIVLHEDLALQQWHGPRAFSNRYEPWERNPGLNVDGGGAQTDGGGGGVVAAGDAVNAPSCGPAPPDRWDFPRHRLKFFNILGEGAFGQVWKCEAADIDDKEGLSVVAVKTLKENASEKERSDLTSELQVMKMLEPHPNVVRLLGCCADKDPLFLIMEYVCGGKLQSYLRSSRAERCYNNMHGQSNTLTSRDLTSFVHQVAKGMEFLSANGIIHRDLAARNILIGDEHTCKVADFGFARDVIDSHVYERKSEGRLPIRWMSPEALYDNVFSVKSDVWSFGVLIWEVVTLGSTPYPGLSAAEVMRKVRDGFRLDKPEHCRRELYNIMYYCWDKDPKQRPAFTECVELLEKLLMSETDYIELERFPDHSYYNMLHLSGEKL